MKFHFVTRTAFILVVHMYPIGMLIAEHLFQIISRAGGIIVLIWAVRKGIK